MSTTGTVYSPSLPLVLTPVQLTSLAHVLYNSIITLNYFDVMLTQTDCTPLTVMTKQLISPLSKTFLSLHCPSSHQSTLFNVRHQHLYQIFVSFFELEDAASGNHLFPFCNPPLSGTFTCRAKAIVTSFFFLLPLRSNISVVQSIVLDRQLLELELGHLVTDNTACLFNFLLRNGITLK